MEKVANSCRLCLQPEVNNPSGLTDACFLVTSSVDSSPFSEKLNSVFSFTLEKIDRLPKLVCGTCCTMVGDFHEFSERVQHNQAYLRMLIEQEEQVKQEKMDEDWDGEEVGQGTEVAPEIVKIEPELMPEGADSSGEDDEGENKLEDEGGDSSASDSDFSEGDDDWTPEVRESREEEPVVRTKRKYTRRAPLKPKKEKKKPGHDPSKDYRNKPKEEIEAEDRLILEYFNFSCELCHDPAETFIELRRHFREVHGQKGFHRCCNKKLFKRCHLLEHIQVHLNPNLYGCDLCSKTFSTREYKELHYLQTHAKSIDRPFKCDKCPKSFIQKGQLTSHMGRHQLYPCNLCDKILAGKGSLSAHMVNMHSDEGRMICDTCGREFKTKTCFDKHTKRHMGVIEDTSIECTVCHEILHNKATLKKHMIAKHTQTNEQHICQQCGKQAPNKFALESHKRKVHCEEKFCCEFCEKRFKNPTTLKEHRATHTGEILYQCLYCTTTFNSKANFYTHIKKIHPAEWEQEKMAKKTQRKMQREQQQQQQQQPGP